MKIHFCSLSFYLSEFRTINFDDFGCCSLSPVQPVCKECQAKLVVLHVVLVVLRLRRLSEAFAGGPRVWMPPLPSSQARFKKRRINDQTSSSMKQTSPKIENEGRTFISCRLPLSPSSLRWPVNLAEWPAWN